MDIQLTVSSTPSSAGTTVNGTNGAATAGNGTASGSGFSSTLNGLIASVPSGDAAKTSATLPVLPALIQLITNMQGQAQIQAPTAENADELITQLDALIKLLDAKDDDSEQLLENPDVQAWLAQMQLILAVQPTTEAASTQPEAELNLDNESLPGVQAPLAGANNMATQASVLNSSLFVPLETVALDNNTAVQITQKASLQPISKEEAVELLNKFKQAVQKDSTSPVVKSIQRSLASLFTLSQQPVQPSLVSVDGPVQAATAAPVIPQALELLAAKTLLPKLESQKASSVEEPLFEPLIDIQASANDSQSVPLHEYVKQVSTGTHIAKTPVLIANAPTFTEDMTQLVLKSFTMNAISEGVTEAKLSLYPQHLGHVDVKLTMQHGQLIAQFMAESAAGKEMLESQLTQLRTTLQSQGIHVEKLEVTQNQAFQSGMFQEQQRQQQSQQSAKQQKGNGTNKVASLEEELAQVASAQSLTSNLSSGVRQTSIDTTA